MTTYVPVRHFFSFTLAILITASSACSYRWDIGAPNGSGGAATGSGGAGHEGTGGTGGGPGPSCATLLAQLDGARDAAKKCVTIGSMCSASITDECGCTSYVTQGGSAAANDFAAAVKSVKDAGCAASCNPCLANPGYGTCLFSSGMGPYCLP
jgi:hypothetical protein